MLVWIMLVKEAKYMPFPANFYNYKTTKRCSLSPLLRTTIQTNFRVIKPKILPNEKWKGKKTYESIKFSFSDIGNQCRLVWMLL